jgi:hypothetical protein
MLSASKSGSASGASGYNLTRSLRFRASASASLSRTPASAGNRQTFTFSFWTKRGAFISSDFAMLFASYSSTSDYFQISFDSLARFSVYDVNGGLSLTTTPVYRDPASWYHFVIAIDTTQATASNRAKIYVNNVEISAWAVQAYPAQNTNLNYNSASIHRIAASDYPSYPRYYDGYFTEINFVNALQLTPSSFGSTNALTGVWQPARYTGTYGTNGFYLPFTDNSALTTSSNVGLGKDFSGNGNYWTTNNISLTSGVTYDSMTDVPTLTSATASNFAVLNPLANGAAVPSGGNLNQGVSGANQRCNSTIMVSSGKWYFEVTLNTAGTNTSVGIGQNNITDQYPGNDILSFVQEIDNARKGNNNTYTAYGTALTAGQVFMCAIDLTNLKLFFGSQGTWFASSDPVTGASPAFTLTAGLYCAISRPYGGSAAISINFGQRPFAYTAPTGFVAMNTYNLPTSTIVKGNSVMDATLYTGTGASLSVTNAGAFKPDLVWVKSRSAATDHKLTDSVRGVTKGLVSDSTAAETTDTNGLTAFNSNGWTLGTDTTYNNSGATYVGWQWQAGQGSTSSNTSGSITSTVSVNASAGFSVVTYTGTGLGATVGHGLGVAPQFIITKNRSAASAWHCYVAAIPNMQNGYIVLNSTAAFSTSTSTVWNGTQPTSSVFSVGTDSGTNGSGNAEIAYCWTPIAGYSAFGSFSGNGSTDGTFIYTGFLPRFVMIKRTSSADDWRILDTARNTYNVMNLELYPNAASAETTVTDFDVLSNGIKLRNLFSGDYIYAAFASTPFKNALAR